MRSDQIPPDAGLATDTEGGYSAPLTTDLHQSVTVDPVTFDASWAGNLIASVLGKGMRVKEGTGAKQGTAVLVGGTVTVSNGSVTSSSRIFLTAQDTGGTPGALRVSARTAGVSFTITSTSAADTSTVAYEIFEPA